MPIQNSRVRVGGSGFTVFHWNDGSGEKLIGFANEVRVAAVTPVAQPVVIQPLNAAQPIEIITPGAHTNGVLTMVLTDLYNSAVWQRLSGLADSQDIIDIMRYVASIGQGITVSKYVFPPTGTTNIGPGLANPNSYFESYYNCVVARVADDETINISTMEINKEIEVWYTYSRKQWINSGRPGGRKFPLIYS